jgi:membrane protein DedA with SNARE-associated domain
MMVNPMKLKLSNISNIILFIFIQVLLVGEAQADTGPIDKFFDPLWNVNNSGVIWSTIVIVLFLSGFGFPLPEDIPLTLAGFTTTKLINDQFVFSSFVFTFVAVVIPILAGDLVAYGMGRRFGFKLRERSRFIARLLREERLARVHCWFQEYGNFTVFLGRQVAGIRFVTFFTAGATRMDPLKFVLFDLLGCLVSVPIWLSLGYLAARYGQAWLEEASKSVGTVFLLCTALATVLLILFVKLRSRRRQPNQGTMRER